MADHAHSLTQSPTPIRGHTHTHTPPRSRGQNWLVEELLPLFSWHTLPPADHAASAALLRALYPAVSPQVRVHVQCSRHFCVYL